MKELHQRLFSLSIAKEGKLIDVVNQSGVDRKWALDFRRRLFSWEEEDLENLYALLENATVQSGQGEDTLIWKADSSGNFSVKSLYKMWEMRRGQEVDVLDLVWRNIAPLKVRCFGWLVWVGRVKTSDWLRNLGVLNESEEYMCIFCGSQVEELNHLLLGCEFTWKIWAAMVRW